MALTDFTQQHPAIGGTVGGLFRDTANATPEAVALRCGDLRLSYGALNERVNRLANALASRNLVRGDRVAILSENNIDYVVILLAAAKLGLIVACVNWRSAAREIAANIGLTRPGFVFVSDAFADNLGDDVPCVRIGDELDRLIADGEAHEPAGEVASEDGLIILYTSGTTGRSKGALVSHRAMIARGLLMRADWAIRRTDGFIAWSPLFHMASADPTFATLVQGGTVTIVEKYDPAAIADALTEHDVGWLVLMPGMIESLSDELERRNARIKRVAAAGCMANLVPAAQIDRVTRLLNAPFLNSFGSSETGITPASGNWIEVGEPIGNLGKLQNTACEIKLVGDDGELVEPGKVGEICLRSPTLFSGYWNDVEATRAAFHDGWYHMGDAFYRDARGLLHFADRKKYLIKSGGENIYPAEIETVLRNADSIEDAVVVRRTDPIWGEVPVAFVVPAVDDLTKEDVLAQLDGKIARFKMPKEVVLITPDEIERNPTGKIRRDILEARAEVSSGASASGDSA
ncbi:class I adenylate-forming enzyme family protein [Thalassovita sp.]|uniref:class I adenylate-forming enzyme family protein n=1 Tax=Thalassovita sp. TaxID=1979401 RepID=UPI0029DE66AD|nr:class I adenylate-forming enzyme family protein [Thalassovita sp.]